MKTDDSCRTCRHWRHSGEKRKTSNTGFCSQWASHDYWPKRGARTPKFLAGVGNGVFTAADEWCYKHKCNHPEFPDSSGGEHE